MDKEDVVHIHSGMLLSHKRKESGSFVVMWTNLESVVQSELSQRERNKYILTHIWNLEKWYWMNIFEGQE